MRSFSVAPDSSKMHTSTLVAFAENSEKLTPLPSQVAPRGCGRPSLTRFFRTEGTVISMAGAPERGSEKDRPRYSGFVPGLLCRRGRSGYCGPGPRRDTRRGGGGGG